ncbi:uncharacterized protein At5g39865 [Cryptomeria japonica]|uniref:uncharacterized protein At5g39865 n=1 Tax=Cryptomeria japonica TaxID=3369 RepID=UPI0027DA8DB0|nr:uncharacterized protein At5g39865 [Cryptomeria japonica]
MGCASSKEGIKRAEGEFNQPLARSMSMPVHHPAEKKGDSYHVVALTSSTYGILKMDPVKDINVMDDDEKSKRRDLQFRHGYYSFRKSLDRSSEMAVKKWSEVNNLISNYKLFRSANHSRTPSLEGGASPETINTWELMEGLEDDCGSSPFPLPNGHVTRKSMDRTPDRNGHVTRKSMDRTLDRSFSLNSVKDVEQLAKDEPKGSIWHRVTPGVKVADENFKACKSNKINETVNEGLMGSPGDSIVKPLWLQQAGDEFHELCPNLFDADLISSFKKALDDIPPSDSMEPMCRSPSPLSPKVEDEKGTFGRVSRLRSGSFQARLNSFQQRIDEGKPPLTPKTPKKSPAAKTSKQKAAPPGGEDKVVLYFTSLRGIRKTFEDCCTVKMILKGFRVWVDERDISMHSAFRQELQDILEKPTTVPRLFIRGKYIGGVEEIQQLHEVGELAKYLEGVPVNTSSELCDGCGDARFVMCPDCVGSRKIFREEGNLMPGRCLQCNENGLIRCPVCCS